MTVIIGCSSDNSNTNSTTEKENAIESDFRRYISILDEMSIGYTLVCGCTNYHTTNGMDSRYLKFIPTGLCPSRKLTLDDYVIILYAGIGDILYPYAYSYNTTNGEILDSTYLHIDNCGVDPWFEGKASTKLDSNYSFQLHDSTYFYNYNDTDTIYSRPLDSIIISSQTIKINSRGQFIKSAIYRELHIP